MARFVVSSCRVRPNRSTPFPTTVIPATAEIYDYCKGFVGDGPLRRAFGIRPDSV
jgi:hypothetical protein